MKKADRQTRTVKTSNGSFKIVRANSDDPIYSRGWTVGSAIGFGPSATTTEKPSDPDREGGNPLSGSEMQE